MSNSRRAVLQQLGLTAAGLVVSPSLPAWAQRASAARPLAGRLGFPGRQVGMHRLCSVETDLLAGEPVALTAPVTRGPGDDVDFSWRQMRQTLRARFPGLSRRFVFEYYPWYGRSPWRHWDQWDRNPPVDIAASHYPRLGPYDSRDLRVVEQHARWIRDAGVGAIDLSWWGRDSYEDRAVDTIMDVMADHDIKVAFHVEPYAPDRGWRLHDDVLYLIRRYGDRRRWDTFLVLDDAGGRQGPVFKTFRTILPPTWTDESGQVHEMADYTPDRTWRRQTDAVRHTLARDFDQVILLADSLRVERVRAAGFDGSAIFSNLLEPRMYAEHARRAARRGLVMSFNCNPGLDVIHRRHAPDAAWYQPPPFAPAGPKLDFSQAEDREEARRRAQGRIRESFQQSLLAQTASDSRNAETGFLLVYVNSFNEWHEGHAFEPAANWSALTGAQRAFGYHNARRGGVRLRTLKRLLRRVL